MRNLFKDGFLKMYLELSGSDLKGSIPNRRLIEMLYAMMCVDEKALEYKVIMPDIAYPAVAREVLDLYHTCMDGFIDGEDYSYLSMEMFAAAFINYLRETKKDIKDVHSMSRYDLMKDVLNVLEEQGVN